MIILQAITDPYLKISKEFHEIADIQSKILEFLAESVNETNYFTIITLAQKYGQEKLQAKILNKIMSKVSEYRSEILGLGPATFERLIGMNDLNVENENEVIRLVKEWIYQNRTDFKLFFINVPGTFTNKHFLEKLLKFF